MPGAPWRNAAGDERVALAVAIVLGAAVLAAAGVSSVLFGFDSSELFTDPSVVADYSDHVGAVSHIGVLTWVAGGAVALLAGSIVARGALRSLLLALGSVSLLLALDDLFRGHENLGEVLHAGEGENVVVAVYGLAVLAILVRMRRVIVERTPLVLLGVAAAFFAASLAADVVLDRGDGFAGQVAVEDGAKLMGIFAWTAYLAVTARRAVMAPPAPPPPPPERAERETVGA
jgi:hypothetical protein